MRFAWTGLRHPVQVVERASDVDWTVVDLSDLDAPDAAARLAALKLADRERGFDLAAGPAWRVALVRLAPTRFELIWTHHHILLDGWSAAALIRDVAARYTGLRQGQAVDLPLAPPFGAYVSWLLQQDRAIRPRLLASHAGRHYGADGCAGQTARHPTGRPCAVTTLGVSRSELDAELTAALVDTARQAGATLGAVVQLAWGLVLKRYSGSDEDVVFGTVVSGRANDFVGAERVVGLAANVVPLRMRLADEDTLPAALAEAHRQMEEAGRYSYLSLADIQSVTAVPAGTPLLHTATAFENYPNMGPAAEALHAVRGDVTDKTNIPLMLLALPGPSLQLRLNYDAGLFDADAMAAMLSHVVQALRCMQQRPATIGDIDVLPEAEHARLAILENGQTEPLAAATVVSLFRACVAQHGPSVALETEEGRLTFEQLQDAAERLAGVLRARHRATHGRPLGPDTRIGLCLERGLGLVVAVWGILIAGAAYVPLDPEYPPERLAFLVSDSACALIIGTRATAGLPGDDAAARMVLLEGYQPTADAWEAAPAGWQGPAATDLAYVIYTSGSTGQPKGRDDRAPQPGEPRHLDAAGISLRSV